MTKFIKKKTINLLTTFLRDEVAGIVMTYC